MLLTVTPAAAARIRSVVAERKDATGLRFGLKDGGCSGYTYDIDFAAAPEAEDVVVEREGARIYVHPLHVPMLEGSVLDYRRERFEEGFHVDNPHAKRTCGCGESFDV